MSISFEPDSHHRSCLHCDVSKRLSWALALALPLSGLACTDDGDEAGLTEASSETGDGDGDASGDGDGDASGDGDGDASGDGDGDASGDGDGDASGDGDGDPSGGEPLGIPEGATSWAGVATVEGFDFLLSIEMNNAGGEVTAEVTIEDDPEFPLGLGIAVYELRGSTEVFGGHFSLAPYGWLMEPELGIELQGVDGVFDPETNTLSGLLIDYANGTELELYDGEFEVALVGEAGPPPAIGDQLASLPIGPSVFVGTHQCSGPVREARAELDYDGLGRVGGEIEIGDPGLDTPLGTIGFVGTHNPTTGGITLAPRLWLDADHNVLTFFIDGQFDPETGAFAGGGFVNNGSCVVDGWNVQLQ